MGYLNIAQLVTEWVIYFKGLVFKRYVRFICCKPLITDFVPCFTIQIVFKTKGREYIKSNILERYGNNKKHKITRLTGMKGIKSILK